MLNNVTEVIEKAKGFISQGQFDQAESELLLALKQKKGTKEIYFLLGDIYLQKNALRKAEEAFKKVIILDSSDYLAHLNLGNIGLLNGDIKSAKGSLSLVLENSVEYRDFAVPLLGEVYFKQEKYYEAYHYFEAALKITPEDEDLLHKAGLCLIKKGLLNHARKFLEKALNRNPQNEKVKHLFTSLKGNKDSIDKATIEESFIKNFKLLKQYYPEPLSPDKNYQNETFAENYEKNLSLLKTHYPHIYEKLQNTPDKLDLQIIPIINGYFDLLLTKNGQKKWIYGLSHPLELSKTIPSICKNNKPSCLIGINAGYELQLLFQIYSELTLGPGEKIPIYVIEPFLDIFKANLMMHDLSSILDSNSVFFFLGDKCLEDFHRHLEIDQTSLPVYVILLDKTIGDIQNTCIQQVNSIAERKNIEKKSLMSQVNTYYDQITDLDWQKVYSTERTRPLRVLGITCRFTTFLKYCMRDVLDGFKQLGCETQVLKENSDVSRLSPITFAKTLNTFRPDLIFHIDHNRAEFPAIPKNIPFVNWVQDEMPNLLDKDAAKKICKKDFFLSATRDHKEQLIKYGYPSEKITVLPIISNTKIYKPVRLKKYEMEKYGCDVSFVHHGGKSPEQELESMLKPITNPQVKKLIGTMYEIVSQRFLNGINCYWNDYEGLLNKAEELSGLKICEGRKTILDEFQHTIGNRFIRQVPLEIIADMGVDLKLYGKDWENHPRLSKYACGIAENGEELNKIFNASKIILHLQPAASTNARVFDGMATGGLLLIQFLKYDRESIANYFEEDRDFIFFRNHEELKEKISYFINHSEERERIGQNAYRKIKEKYNYKGYMKHLLEIIAKTPNNITSEL